MTGRSGRLTGSLLFALSGIAALLGAARLPVHAAGSSPPGGPMYVDGPPPGHTGGFGEPTCRSCHFDHPLAPDSGRLEVRGLPDRFRPGSTYVLTVELDRPGLDRAGFQLAIRRESGPERGRSAGTLYAPGDRVQLVTDPEDRITYGQHTHAGSEPSSPARSVVSWRLLWRAPERRGDVVLHVAANAANGDDSEFGDHIYARRLISRAEHGESGGDSTHRGRRQ